MRTLVKVVAIGLGAMGVGIACEMTTSSAAADTQASLSTTNPIRNGDATEGQRPASTTVQRQAFLTQDQMASAWRDSYGSLQSFRVVSRDRLIEHTPDGPTNVVPDIAQERIEQGSRYWQQSLEPETGDNTRSVYAFDGKTSTQLEGDTGIVSPGLMNRAADCPDRISEFLAIAPAFDGSATPAFLYLMNLKGHLRPQLEQVSGEWCHVMEVSPLDAPAAIRAWIAHEKGMLLMKYQLFNNGLLVQERIVHELGSARAPDGKLFWYPERARYVLAGGKERPVYEFTVREFEPNIDVAAHPFRVAFPKGTRVADFVMRSGYEVGDGGKHLNVLPFQNQDNGYHKGPGDR